jgi:hypothetical protein
VARVALILLAWFAGACSQEGSGSGPPATPDKVEGRALGVRGAEVGWRDRSEGRAWFVVERRDPGGAFAAVGIRPPSETVWVDWGLAPDTTYEYRISAADASGTSPPSAQVAIHTSPTVLPEPRVEVLDARLVSPGVTLMNVEDPDDVYTVSVVMAVDEQGGVLWHFEHEGQFVSETDLFPNGDVLAQVGPNISRMNRKGDLVDYYDEFYVHHDVDVLPWGNLMAITSVELQERKEPSDWFSRDWIIEIDTRTRLLPRIVHLEFLVPEFELCAACIVSEVTGGRDWIHANSVDYDLVEEAVYVSVRNLNRIYKLSYPEGEVEWIMGDGGDFGEGLFDHQHNPVRIEPGLMLLFDNGLHSDPLETSRSRVIEIEYDPEALAARIVWEYAGPPAFYSEAQGDATRLLNGNTLVVDGFNGRIVEVTRDGTAVWELSLPPPYYIYKAHRIPNFL